MLEHNLNSYEAGLSQAQNKPVVLFFFFLLKKSRVEPIKTEDLEILYLFIARSAIILNEKRWGDYILI